MAGNSMPDLGQRQATESHGLHGSHGFRSIWTNASTGLGEGDIRALVANASDSTILYAATSKSFFQDAFVSKLNSSGSGLLFSTYLGGFSGDAGLGIAVDASGNISVVGETSSTNFPAVNAMKSAPSPAENCQNAFVTKLNPAVPSFVFSTYLGGSECDVARSVAIDQSANIYVTGLTNSADFPIASAFQSTLADSLGGDAFVTKLTSSGSLTLWVRS